MSPRLRESQERSGPDRRAKFTLLKRDTTPSPKSFSWWVAQADRVEGACEKCQGMLAGSYVPPSRDTMHECAVVAHCRMCGSERVVLIGYAGVPVTEQEPPRVRAPGTRGAQLMRPKRKDDNING